MDIKDSYLHGTVGVVKSISVSADKLKYKLADIAGTVKEITLPVATTSANGLMSSADKNKLDAFNSGSLKNNLVLKINSGTTEGTSLYTYNGSSAKTLDIKNGTGIGFTNNAGSLQIYNSGVRSITTGTTNGTISVNTNGTSTDIAVRGLGSAAYISKDNLMTYIAINNNYVSAVLPTDTLKQIASEKYIEYWSSKGWLNSKWGWIEAVNGFKGNASSATKLQTKRKLWGLDFDGTADVSGNMTSVGSINMTDNITIQGTNLDRFLNFYHDFNSPINSWRIGYIGTGAGNNNLLSFESSGADSIWKSALYIYNETRDAVFTASVTAPTFKGNLDGNYINKLTEYTKATAASSLVATDTLNIALGKLEYKADTAYNWYKSVTGADNDDIINKWEEIVDFIDSVKEGTDITDEFVTRKTDLTITGAKTFSNNITLSAVDKDRFLNFLHTGVTGYDWRIGYLGSGTDDANYFVILSDKTNGTYVNALRIGLISLAAVFGGTATASKFITSGGTSSLFVKGDGSLDSTSYATTSSLGNYVLKKPITQFYNYIGCSARSNWYRVTFPFHNTTSINSRWMMVSMELILKGNYSSGADGTIYLSYYIHYPANNNVGEATNVYALAIGSNMNSIRIAYDKTDLGILYVYVPNEYNSFAIQNLSANDTARTFDFTTTKIESLSSANYPADSEILNVNIRKLYTTNGTSLMLNGNILIDAGNYNSYSPTLTGTGASGTWNINISGNATTASTSAKLASTTIISSKAFSLSNASWTDTGYTFANLDTGTYAVQVTFGTTLVASGIMSVYKNLADTAGDEIPLHVYGTAGWRPYLRTYANKLLISSNDVSVTSRTVTIKIALIL